MYETMDSTDRPAAGAGNVLCRLCRLRIGQERKRHHRRRERQRLFAVFSYHFRFPFKYLKTGLFAPTKSMSKKQQGYTACRYLRKFTFFALQSLCVYIIISLYKF